jgi:F0F1-type ATP synthase delta subunit
MKQSRRHLAEAIARRTMSVKDDRKLAREVAAYLLSEGITVELESLMRDIMQYRQEHGHIEAVAISAHGLNPVVINDIKAILKDTFPAAKSITVTEHLDPEVIGGVRIRLANQQLDMTVQDKLNTFKRLTAGVKE